MTCTGRIVGNPGLLCQYIKKIKTVILNRATMAYKGAGSGASGTKYWINFFIVLLQRGP